MGRRGNIMNGGCVWPRHALPPFFVSVDSERLIYYVTSLESTLLGLLASVDFK
jgi:hypothetical protein